MLENINLENILFLDIETVPAASAFEELSERMQKLWEHKAERLRKNDLETATELYKRAGIYAEFGKIICISVGYLHHNEFRIKSFSGHDEKQLLLDFSLLLNIHFNKPEQQLCAHNGREFDFPYISRRMVVHGIKLPALLELGGKKPWEVNHLDTMELWKFGDFKNYTSLELLAALFDIPTPKDDIDGSQVAKVYYEEQDLPRIVNYCNKDVLTIFQIFRKYRGEGLFKEDQVVIID